MGGGMDLRGGQSKKSDEAGKGISDLGKSEFPCSIFMSIFCRMDCTYTTS